MKEFLYLLFQETKKVNWLKHNAVISGLGAVLVVILVTGIFIFILDVLITSFVKSILFWIF